MAKSDITVTMPLREYEDLQRQIAHLKDQQITNFVKREYFDITKNQYVLAVDVEAIKRKYEE